MPPAITRAHPSHRICARVPVLLPRRPDLNAEDMPSAVNLVAWDGQLNLELASLPQIQPELATVTCGGAPELHRNLRANSVLDDADERHRKFLVYRVGKGSPTARLGQGKSTEDCDDLTTTLAMSTRDSANIERI